MNFMNIKYLLLLIPYSNCNFITKHKINNLNITSLSQCVTFFIYFLISFSERSAIDATRQQQERG